MNWISDMFEGKDAEIKKQAELINQETEWERKIEANDWVKDVMSIDETEVARDAARKQAAEEAVNTVEEPFDQVGAIMAYEGGELSDADTLKLFSHLIKTGLAWSLQGHYGRTAKALIDAGWMDDKGTILKDIPNAEIDDEACIASFKSFIKKTAAYTRGDTAEETVKKDYELGVSGLSDYNLAEMLAEYSCLENNTATLNLNEEKESQMKSVKSGRDAAEKKLLKYLGDHTLIDWKKSFKAMEDSEVKHAGEKDLYATWKEGKMAWDKDTKFDSPSDKEKLEQMEGVGKEEEKGQVGKEAGKTEFVKCPTCDSIAARKHEDGSVTCVTCDHGKTDKKAALKSVEEKVEKKLNQLIDQKLEEAFNPAPEMPAIMPTDVAPIIDAPKPDEKPVEEPKKKEDEKEASLKKADFPMDIAPAPVNDTEPIAPMPETPLSQELGLEEEPVSTEIVDSPMPMVEPSLDKPADPAQATLDALKSSLDALEVLVKDKPELHALIEETENKIFEIEKSLTGGVSVSPEEIMEPEHKDVLETPAPEKKEEPKKDKPEEKKDEKKEEKKDDKKEEKSDEKKDDKEIESQASKKDVIAKVAEIASPWRVIKNDKGEEVIARISPLHTEKKSKEQEVKKDIHSQDVR